MTSVTSVGSFRTLLEQSDLLAEEYYRPYFQGIPESAGEDEVDAICTHLVHDHLLTNFQARQLMRGRYRDFFIKDKYKLLELIGSGGMGKIYLGEHLLLERLVAIKMLNTLKPTAGLQPNSTIERFYREARAIASLEDPNIVRFYDIDLVQGMPYMVMEFVDGANLHELVSRHGVLTIERAADYIRQAAKGLQHAHEVGLVHRDIKPNNMVLERDGTIKLLDLGLARFASEPDRNRNITDRYDLNMVLGTVDFMAPEQTDGVSPVDIRSDIYSLGCSFYYLLTGRPPFPEGNDTQKMVSHKTRDPEPLSIICPRLPSELIAVIERMIEKDPAERYQTPAEVVQAINALGLPTPPPPSANEMPKKLPSAYRLGLSSKFRHSSAQLLTPNPMQEAETPLNHSDPLLDLSDSGSVLKERPRSEDAGITMNSSVSFIVQAPKPTRPKWLVPTLIGTACIVLLVLIVYGVNHWGQAPVPKDSPDALALKNTPNPITPVTPQANTPFQGPVVQGGGSTFVAPMMNHWATIYEKQKGVRISYQSVGSGKGSQGVIDGVYLFGCTDAAFTDDQLAAAKKAGNEVVHVPLVMGAVVPAYNLTDIEQPLRFTGAVLADIYLGKITRWNDPAIQINNPGVKLPNMPITVVHRAETSGTTFIFTDYLSKVSAEWQSKVGAKTQVNWPVGIQGMGNEGIAEQVSRHLGSIGYLEMTFALQRNLRIGEVRNRDGRFVPPNLESVTAAASASLTTIPADLRYTLTDAAGEGTYPIVGTCWAVVVVDQRQRSNAKELISFLRWVVHEGQGYVKDLKYAPLPPELIKRVDDKLNTIKINDAGP